MDMDKKVYELVSSFVKEGQSPIEVLDALAKSMGMISVALSITREELVEHAIFHHDRFAGGLVQLKTKEQQTENSSFPSVTKGQA